MEIFRPNFQIIRVRGFSLNDEVNLRRGKTFGSLASVALVFWVMVYVFRHSQHVRLVCIQTSKKVKDGGMMVEVFNH